MNIGLFLIILSIWFIASIIVCVLLINYLFKIDKDEWGLLVLPFWLALSLLAGGLYLFY